MKNILEFLNVTHDPDPLLDGIYFNYHFILKPSYKNITIIVGSMKLNNLMQLSAKKPTYTHEEFEKATKETFTALQLYIERNILDIINQESISITEGALPRELYLSDTQPDYINYGFEFFTE